MADAVPEHITRIYEIVAEMDNLAADDAIVRALPQLDEPTRRLAIGKLIKRNHAEGLMWLVERFSTADDDLKRLILGHTDELYEAVRKSISSDRVEARVGAIEIIHASRDARLAYLLAAVLSRRCPRSTTAAANALCDLAAGWADRNATVSDEPDARGRLRSEGDRLAEALCGALDCWVTHFRVDVLAGAMWLADFTEKRLLESASNTRTNLARAMNEVCRGEFGPRMAPYALRALTHADLRSVAAFQLSHCNDLEIAKALVGNGWLLLDPAISKACNWVRALPWMDQLPTLCDQRHAEGSEPVMRLIAAAGVPSERKLREFKRLILGENADARDSALWSVVAMNTPEAAELLRRIVGWNIAGVSRVAAHELFRRERRVPVAAAPGESMGPAGSTAASEDDCFANFWDRFEAMNEKDRRAQARQLSKTLSIFDARIQSNLTGPQLEDRLKALAVVRLSGKAKTFTEQIYALSHDSNEKIRSSAVMLLGVLESATAVRILRLALSDPDSRVRANAVEVLEALALVESVPMITAKLNESDNRVRANAVKALLTLRKRDAAVTLFNMLADADPAHRLSGLWVIERLGLSSMSHRVLELAQNDPEQRVRERARLVLRHPSEPDPTLDTAAMQATGR